MKNRLIPGILLLTVALNGFAAEKAGDMAPGMMMGMMNHEQMMQMHAHMQEMQKLMGDIREEKNAERRMEMMHDHMSQMNEAMRMMGANPGNSMMGATGDKTMADMSMQERMDMMQNQMGLMQAMMSQMMQHFTALTENKDEDDN